MTSRTIPLGSWALSIAVAAAVVWQHYYPRSPMFAQLGMPGPRANSSRTCNGWYRQRRWGNIRVHTPMMRGLTCRGITRADRWGREEVELDRLSRQIKIASRIWSVPDSATWLAARDSIRQALEAAGGKSLNCPGETDRQSHITSITSWRFSNFAVRLVAYHPANQGARRDGPPDWMLQVDGYPGDPPDCLRSPLFLPI